MSGIPVEAAILAASGRDSNRTRDAIAGFMAVKEWMDERGQFDTPERLAHLLGQCAHESTGFTRKVENLNYTSAERIRTVFGKRRFPSLADAQEYVRQPRLLANKVYGGRMGNTGPDDGWRFKGRGWIQLTGRDNYRRFGPPLGMDLERNPELAAELDLLEAQWPAALPTGVIHADLFPDNVFFLGEELSGIIDFYFACNDFFAYDLGVCLNAWCFEPDRGFNITKARRLLTAYGKVRDFSADELAALPVLARGSAMRFLATRLFDWLHTPADALVRRKDPLEYLAKLRFHQGVKGAGDYGL